MVELGITESARQVNLRRGRDEGRSEEGNGDMNNVILSVGVCFRGSEVEVEI